MVDFKTTDEIGKAKVFAKHEANNLVFELNCHHKPTGPKAKRWARCKNGFGCSVACLDGEGKLCIIANE